jgi:hypothetical protein
MSIDKPVTGFGKDIGNMFSEASIGFKIQLIWLVVFILGCVAVGFGYLSGNLEVEKTPVPVESNEPLTNLCSETTGDCYDIEPTEPFVDDFPSRP